MATKSKPKKSLKNRYSLEFSEHPAQIEGFHDRFLEGSLRLDYPLL